MARINKIGVELEGGWDSDKDGNPISASGEPMEDRIGHDGSVKGFSCPHYGEAPSPAGSIDETLAWMKKYYPSHMNQSCGFHVHVSFKNLLSYQRLMDTPFWEFFQKELKAYGKERGFKPSHPFWERVNGNSHFCTATHNPDGQVERRGKGDHRYTQLNYSFADHNTLECRVLPGFEKVEDAIHAVKWLCNLYEGYLEKLPREERKTLNFTEKDLARGIRL